MSDVLKLLSGIFGDKLDAAAILKLALVLAPIVGDLTDGDARLSAESRLKIQEAAEEVLA